MPSRKSFIEIGWKLDTSNLNKANKITDEIGKRWNKNNDYIDKFNDYLVKSNQLLNKSSDLNKKQTNSVKTTANETKKSYQQQNNYQKKIGESIDRNSRKSSESARKQSLNLDKYANSMVRFGKAASISSTAIGAGIAYSAKQAIDLQNQYKVINNLAVTGGEKSAEAQRNVNLMRKQGTNLSDRYGVSQKKLSAGYEELIRRGYTTNQALSAQKTFLEGSIASGDDYTDVVHNATAAIESFGLKSNDNNKMASNTKLALNQMAYAADLTATDFQGMGDAMRYAGATARSTNQSMAETASAVGILSNNGLWKLASQLEMVA